MLDLTDFEGIVFYDVCEFTLIKGCIDSELKKVNKVFALEQQNMLVFYTFVGTLLFYHIEP